jgi:5-methylcytosine-specific restriction endonuclease McrBC GTP-binding regulatory subunit McrB
VRVYSHHRSGNQAADEQGDDMTKEQAIQKAIQQNLKGREATFPNVEGGFRVGTDGVGWNYVTVWQGDKLVERVEFDGITGEITARKEIK